MENWGVCEERVGIKLRWDLKAAYAKSMRFSSNTGVPHFNVSVAFGATFFKIARISSNFSRASLGAAFIYSVTVVALVFAIAIEVGILIPGLS